jgi:cytidylate kinase
MYRAVTLLANRAGIAPSDGPTLAHLLHNMLLTTSWVGLEMHVIANGEDVTPLLRRPEIDQAVRFIASLPETRQKLLLLQRQMAKEGGVVMEGRDIGSVVLPNADLKVYLDATIEVRAERRWREHQNRGENISLDEVIDEVYERDKLDSEREHSPLVRASDAILVDNTGIGIEETVRLIVLLARERQGEMAKTAKIKQ